MRAAVSENKLLQHATIIDCGRERGRRKAKKRNVIKANGEKGREEREKLREDRQADRDRLTKVDREK